MNINGALAVLGVGERQPAGRLREGVAPRPRHLPPAGRHATRRGPGAPPASTEARCRSAACTRATSTSTGPASTATTGTTSGRRSADMLGPTYDAIQAIAPSKPVLIGETASTEKGGSKANWITDALTVADPEQLPERQGRRLVREVGGPGLADRDARRELEAPSPRASLRRSMPARTFADVPSPIPPLSPVVTQGAIDGGSANTRRGHRTRRNPVPPTAAKRCVARRSKVTGKRVLVCTKASSDQALAIKPRIRTGTQPPIAVARRERGVPPHAEPERTKVVLRFARRSGTALRRGAGIGQASRCAAAIRASSSRAAQQQADAGPGPLPPVGHRRQRHRRALADRARHVHAAPVAPPRSLDVRPSPCAADRQPVRRSDVEPLPPRA